MALKFRNIDADPADPVSSWPTEGLIAALERGDITDWARIAAAVRRDPWGSVARRLEEALSVTRPYGTGALMERALAAARSDAEAEERADVSRRVRQFFKRSGLTRDEFAAATGTSASRLSTYLTGKVAPASTMLIRMERVADMALSEGS